MKRDINYDICGVKFTTQNSIHVKFVTNSMSASAFFLEVSFDLSTNPNPAKSKSKANFQSTGLSKPASLVLSGQDLTWCRIPHISGAKKQRLAIFGT